MSERINVDQAFDPEARKAQSDFDAYMDSRPYQDEKGNVHNPDNGKFMKGTDEYHEDARNEQYDATLAEGDYSGETLDQLAKRVADARAHGDKTLANDAEEMFFTKFNEYAEKYKWDDEKIDESATGQLAVDKNATIGRDTIDARLERYGKIMYGEKTPVPVSVETPVVDAAEVSESITDAEHEADTESDVEAETDKPAGIDEQIEAAKAKLSADAEARTQKAISDMNDTDQAKADRELLNPVSTEGIEPVDGLDTDLGPISLDGLEAVDGPNAEPALEGESLEEYEARTMTQELTAIETDGLESVDENADEQTETASRFSRLRRRLSPTALAAHASAWNYQRNERAQYRERSNNRKAVIGLGVLATVVAGVGIYAANKYGLDFNGGSGGASGGSKKDLIDQIATKKNGGGGLNWNDFDPSARRVTPGEGFYNTFDQMGIPKDHWSGTLQDAGPKLGKIGEAYFDKGAGEWRISQPGQLSGRSLHIIAASARKDGVNLAA